MRKKNVITIETQPLQQLCAHNGFMFEILNVLFLHGWTIGTCCILALEGGMRQKIISTFRQPAIQCKQMDLGCLNSKNFDISTNTASNNTAKMYDLPATLRDGSRGSLKNVAGVRNSATCELM